MGGASKENITVMNLTIDQDVMLRGLYFRSKHLFEVNGGTLGAYMREVHGWDGGEGDDMTQSEFVEFAKNMKGELHCPELFQDVPYGKTVDCSSRNMETLDAIDDALGLLGKRQSGDLTYEEIAHKVKAVDAIRDAEFSKNIDIAKLRSRKEKTTPTTCPLTITMNQEKFQTRRGKNA